MARACPACNRPNSDAAERCLYCSNPLPPRTEPEHPVDAVAASDRHLVILIPAGEPDDEKLEAFSRITSLGLYEARQCLLARRPRLFRILPSGRLAQGLSESLCAARIAHYVVSEPAVLSIPIAPTRRVELQNKHLTCTFLERPPLTLRHDDLLLVVRGEIRRERHDEKRLGNVRGVSQRLSPGELLHLYTSAESVAIEVEPSTFDWDVLGAHRTTSALLNVERLLSGITEKAPSAAIDCGFDDEPVVLARAQGGDPTQALIESSPVAGKGVLYDNEAQFRFYARWRYRLEKFLSPRRKEAGSRDGGLVGPWGGDDG